VAGGAIGGDDFFKGWLHVVEERLDAPDGDFGVSVSRLQEGGEELHGEVVALLESTAIENQNGGFAVDGGVGAR